NHCVLVHLDGIRQTPEGSPSFYATLDEAEHEFASSAFLRIHKSYLINGDHILQMSNYKVLLDTGMTLKGSRKYFSKAKLEFYRGR
ncbi:MAG: LytTR family DNA-binding domain-containing protein, partial [Dialister invisus]|nr:LytTR family DNA-binding domain-containing protein [Dialister invisus]